MRAPASLEGHLLLGCLGWYTISILHGGPLDWQTGVVVTIFKNGDQRVWSNFRRIILLSLPGKVYARALERRIRPMVEPWIQEQQHGFPPVPPGPALYPLTATEGFMGICPTSLHAFCGLVKAYNCVRWGIMWEVLREYGVPGSPFGLSTNKARAWFAFLDIIQTFSLWVWYLSFFLIFMDRISRSSKGIDCVQFGSFRIADDSGNRAPKSCLLVSSSCDL